MQFCTSLERTAPFAFRLPCRSSCLRLGNPQGSCRRNHILQQSSSPIISPAKNGNTNAQRDLASTPEGRPHSRRNTTRTTTTTGKSRLGIHTHLPKSILSASTSFQKKVGDNFHRALGVFTARLLLCPLMSSIFFTQPSRCVVPLPYYY